MNTPIWRRAVFQLGVVVMLGALAAAVFGVTVLLGSTGFFPDPNPPGNVSAVNMLWYGPLFAALGAVAAAITQRLLRRPWDALVGVGLFALFIGWQSWLEDFDLATTFDLPVTHTATVVIALSVVVGCVLAATIFQRRTRASSGGVGHLPR